MGATLFGSPPAAATGADRPALHNEHPTPTPTPPAMDMPMGAPVAAPTPALGMAMPDTQAAAPEAAHSHSTTDTNTPSDETKGWVVGTLGLVNGGVILTAAVLKQKNPKKPRVKPAPRADQ